YTGDTGGNRNFDIGGLVASNISADLRATILVPQWVPETPVANGRLSLGMMGILANSDVSANVSFQRLPVDIQRSDDVFGLGDLYPQASLAWNSGVNN